MHVTFKGLWRYTLNFEFYFNISCCSTCTVSSKPCLIAFLSNNHFPSQKCFLHFWVLEAIEIRTVWSFSWRINGRAQVVLIQEMKAVINIMKVFRWRTDSLRQYCFLSFNPPLNISYYIQQDEEIPFSIAPCRVDAQTKDEFDQGLWSWILLYVYMKGLALPCDLDSQRFRKETLRCVDIREELMLYALDRQSYSLCTCSL